MTVRPAQVLDHMENVILGKRPVLEQTLAAMLSGGHVLIQDVPGVAKTMLARTLAKTFHMDFSRVQMTPDLLPADLTGSGIWDEGQRTFVFQAGPIFAQIVLADELNRATPRTQAGLLEAMEERRVTADGTSHDLPEPFFVLATQNPVEQHGVYPLPEAQLDRFMIQISLGYPSQAEELAVVRAQTQVHPLERLEPLATLDDYHRMREEALLVHTDPMVMEYLVKIVRATREQDELALGASPRASICLHHLARSLAYVRGAQYVTPDHVKECALPVLRHRLVLTPQARLALAGPDQIVRSILDHVEVPIYTGEG